MKKKTKVPKDWEDRPGSFERFERLAKGLMAVPKKELDRMISTTERKNRKPKKRTA